jgi:hypothetical protein
MIATLADTACTPGMPGAGIRWDIGADPPEIRDRIPGFHTDFTQNDRSGPHTLRHPGQPTNAQMPMKSQKAAQSADFPADPPLKPLKNRGSQGKAQQTCIYNDAPNCP